MYMCWDILLLIFFFLLYVYLKLFKPRDAVMFKISMKRKKMDTQRGELEGNEQDSKFLFCHAFTYTFQNRASALSLHIIFNTTKGVH